MQKRIIATLLLLCMSTALLCGCGNPPEDPLAFRLQEAVEVELTEGDRTVSVTSKTAIQRLAAQFDGKTFQYPEERVICDCPDYDYTLVWYNDQGEVMEQFTVIKDHLILRDHHYYELADNQTPIDLSLFDTILEGRYYQKPADTALEFWITEDVGEHDFTGYDYNPGFGCEGYCGKGYSYSDEKRVDYTIAGYPDCTDPIDFVTDITITDPSIVILYGLTLASTSEEWESALRSLGFYQIPNPIAPERGFVWESADGVLLFYVSSYSVRMDARTTNIHNVVF